MSRQNGQGGTGTGPADIAPALAIAGELHPATPSSGASRTAAARRAGAREGAAGRARRRAARG